MLTTPLTSREDLVEALDSEALFDYLIQHGVLDEGQCEGIQQEQSKVKRNTTLLEYVEGTGDSAVALFINALRQSGQLHLASSLDVTSRIKPTYGSGYLGKERHKGQVTIRVEVGSILAMFPVWEEGDDLDEKQGDTPEKTQRSDSLLNVVFTPRRAHKSYENMTMLDEPASSRSWKIKEYNYDSDDDTGSSCWCFCRSKRRKGKPVKDRESRRKLEYEIVNSKYEKSQAYVQDKKKEKYLNGNYKYDQTSSLPPRELALLKKDKQEKKNTASPSRNGKCDARVLYSKGELSEAKLTSELREIYRNSLNSLNNRLGSSDSLNLKYSVNSVRSSVHSLEGKENLPPDLNSQVLRHTSPTKEQRLKQNFSNIRDSLKSQSKEPVENCVMWKSRGPTFDGYAEKLYNSLDNSVNIEIVKYFEQERGTLVLSVSVEDSLVICTICMTTQQIQHIVQDIENQELLKMFEGLLLSQDIKDAMCVSDLKLKVVIEQEEINLALSELG